MKTFVLSNQKGGCGKTSTAHALGFGLAEKGFRVLLVDSDAQCNLCDYCGIDTEQAEGRTLYDVFKGRIQTAEAIQPVTQNIDLLLGDLSLSEADSEFTSTGREYMLKEALDPLQNEYDYCVIDTEPHLGILLANALTSADAVIIPLTASRFSIKGMKQLCRYINSISKYTNPTLKIEGILLTRYSERLVLNRILLDEVKQLAEDIGTKLFDTTIRQAIAMDESQFLQEDIFSQDSAIADDYRRFVNELLEGGKHGK